MQHPQTVRRRVPKSLGWLCIRSATREEIKDLQNPWKGLLHRKWRRQRSRRKRAKRKKRLRRNKEKIGKRVIRKKNNRAAWKEEQTVIWEIR